MVRVSFTRPPNLTSLKRRVFSCIRSAPVAASLHRTVSSNHYAAACSRTRNWLAIEAVAAKALGFEGHLQILYAVFGLAPLEVVIVEVLGIGGFVCDDEAGVGAFLHNLGLVDE